MKLNEESFVGLTPQTPARAQQCVEVTQHPVTEVLE